LSRSHRFSNSSSRNQQKASFLSYLLETASYLISLAYNVRQGFPFSTFGETALIAAQNVVIAVLVLQFGGKSAAAGVFVAGLAAAGYALFNGAVVDMKLLSYLQAGAGY
jgi:mannose-P-dolichol utilization defect protein 1